MTTKKKDISGKVVKKKTTKKKEVEPKEVKSSKRGNIPTKEDNGYDILDSSKITLMSINSLHVLTGRSKETIKIRLTTLNPDFSGNGPTGGRFYDPKKALPLIYEVDAYNSKENPQARINDPKFRKEMALAEKAELELAEYKKTVIPISDIIEQVAEEYALIRQRLLSIPGRLAKRILLAKNEKDSLEMLSTDINLALEELNADSREKLKALDNEKEKTIETIQDE